jgi:hypothetical protein
MSDFSAILAQLGKGKSIRTFYNVLDDDRAVALATALKGNTTVKSVDITTKWRNSYHNIGVVGMAALASALKENSTVQSFKLTRNDRMRRLQRC